jgi:hypothetical protein
MDIVFQCDCGKKLKVPGGHAGKTARCPECQAILAIPAAGSGKADGGRVEKAGPVESPKHRPREHVQEENDAPRVQEPAGDDGNDDDVLHKKGKKGRSKLLLFALLGGGAIVFLLVVVAGLAFVPHFLGYGYFFLSGGGGGLGEHIRYFPDTTKSVRSVLVEKVRDSDLYTGWQKDASTSKSPMNGQQIEDFLGVREEDIERVTKATTKDEEFTIISTKKKLETSLIVSKFKFKETKVGKYTMYEPSTGGSGATHGFGASVAFAFPTSNIYVAGPPNGLKSILERDGQPSLSEDMKHAMSMADFSKCMASASEFRDSKAAGSVTTIHTDAEYETDEAEISSDVSVRYTVAYRDSKTAESRESEMKEFMNKMHDYFKSGTTDVSLSGSKVTGTLRLNSSEAKQHMNDIFRRLPVF